MILAKKIKFNIVENVYILARPITPMYIISMKRDVFLYNFNCLSFSRLFGWSIGAIKIVSIIKIMLVKIIIQMLIL
mgnify:CR=1 FL=1